MDLLELALADQTAAAFNPFHGGVVPSNMSEHGLMFIGKMKATY